jgi:hypothetical protein
VALIPLQKGTLPDGVMAVGPINSAGDYTIMTGGKNGAPVGQYKVAVSPPTMPSPDGKMTEQWKIFQNYSAGKTELQIGVEENHGPYNLTLNE